MPQPQNRKPAGLVDYFTDDPSAWRKHLFSPNVGEQPSEYGAAQPGTRPSPDRLPTHLDPRFYPAEPRPARDLMKYPGMFFDQVATSFNQGRPLDDAQRKDVLRLLNAFSDAPESWKAAALGNFAVEHRDLRSGAERNPPTGNYVRAELGNRNLQDAARYAGAGGGQITGRENFARAGAALDLPLVENPELARDPGVWPRIFRWGVEDGAFVGKPANGYRAVLPDAGPATIEEFARARNAINPNDKQRAANESLAMQSALFAAQTGGVDTTPPAWMRPSLPFAQQIIADPANRPIPLTLFPR